jgi:hypothetical protein
MDAYVAEIRKLESKFSGLEIHHVIHDNNVGPDVLSKLGSDRANVPLGVFVHELHLPSIKTPDSSIMAQGPKEPDREVLMIEVDRRVTFIDYIQVSAWRKAEKYSKRFMKACAGTMLLVAH